MCDTSLNPDLHPSWLLYFVLMSEIKWMALQHVYICDKTLTIEKKIGK